MQSEPWAVGDSGASAVSCGSITTWSVTTDSFHAEEMIFPPQCRLPRHYHTQAIFTVPLRGRFELMSQRRRFVCRPGTVFTIPLGVPHSSSFAEHGTRSLVIAPLDRDGWMCASTVKAFRDMHVVESPPVARIAKDIAREVRQADALTPLAIDGMILQMVALTLRTDGWVQSGGRPTWLKHVVELIHESRGRRLTLAAIAAAVDARPDYVARGFRAAYGVSIARFARTVRLDRAAERLASTDDPIDAIARDAGFADQSHFTRVFRTLKGVTPAKYRRAVA